jgi:hypothetical protein
MPHSKSFFSDRANVAIVLAVLLGLAHLRWEHSDLNKTSHSIRHYRTLAGQLVLRNIRIS